MVRRPLTFARLFAAFSGTSLLALLGAAGEGQEFRTLPLDTVVVAQQKEAAQPAPAQPKQPVEPPKTPSTAPQAPPDVAPFGSEAGAATGGEFASLAAPNMIGNTPSLGAFRSVRFFVNREAGAGFINALGSTSLVNPAVAENNSPIPTDRVYFRYNHFDNALSVTGASATPAIQIAPGVFQAFSETRFYNSDMYTFGFEKTFAEQRGSLEFRLPMATQLAPNLDLSYGQVTSPNLVPSNVPGVPGVFYQTAATPANTLGHSNTQIGDLTLIFKWLLLQRDWLRISGGLAGGIPTAPDERVRVTDFLGPLVNLADTIRYREFHIHNQTWVLSPFVAALVTPTDRFFMQGFLEYDAPLNSSAIDYSEAVVQTPTAPMLLSGPFRPTPPFTYNDHIREQSLFHIDFGTGYWLLKDPQRRYLTAFAPTAELHYLTTLMDADIRDLPGDRTARLDPALRRFVENPPPPLPQVGNFRNRVDILDLTLGTTFEFGGRTRLATAFGIPLRGADNRVYDWEFHVQLNYYFGAFRGGMAPPNF